MNNKMYMSAYAKEFNVDDRTITAVASSGKIDRDREVTRTNGWDLDEFLTHPVILLGHNRSQLWIGKALWVKKTKGGLLFKAQFATTEAAQEAFQLIKDTEMAAFSVGFEVLQFKDMTVSELEDHEKEGSKLKANDMVRVLTKTKLMEISLVSLPADQNALMKYAYEPTAIVKAGFEGKILTKGLKQSYEDVDFNDYVIKEEDGEELESDTGLEVIDNGNIDNTIITMTEEQINALIDARLAAQDTTEYIEVSIDEPDDEYITISSEELALAIADAVATKQREIIEKAEAEISRSIGRALGKIM